MSKITSIGWTDHTFNPWWGCVKVSAGCDHCYAATYAHRYGFGWGPQAKRRILSSAHWKQPLAWDQQAAADGVRRKVFCASMADVFEDNPQVVAERQKLWDLIAATPNLDWQLLTKRPENVNKMVPAKWLTDGFPKNVWIGTSVEHQAAADKRIPELLKVNASVRFLSCEPLIGPVDLSNFDLASIDWAIIGGESGPGARAMDPAWARSIKDQCVAKNMKVFVKQMGGVRNKRAELDDLPSDLRLREFPVSKAGMVSVSS
jgi:protein gp37